jgi:predicted nucleic acid-binding protein
VSEAGPEGGGLAYVEASAVVKLLRDDPEAGALTAALERHPEWVSAAVTEVESVRAARLAGVDVARAREQVARLRLLVPTEPIRRRAGELDPPGLPALAAVHLSTALDVRESLAAFYCYDDELRQAAEALGLPVAAPR